MTGVGKINDIFAGCDIDDSHPTKSNADGLARTIALAREGREGLVFVNLVETDMTYGHRNDPEGFHRCLQEFDAAIPDLRAALGPDDLLVLTSDHGCDPTTALDRPLARVRAAARARARARRPAAATTASSPTSARPPRPGSGRPRATACRATPIDPVRAVELIERKRDGARARAGRDRVARRRLRRGARSRPSR